MSGRHAEGDGQTPLVPVALIVGPGDRLLSGVIRYTGAGMLLPSRADAVAVHSEFDRRELRDTYPQLAHLRVQVVCHGPYAHHAQFADGDGLCGDGNPCQHRLPRPGEPVRVLRTALPLLDKARADPHSWVRNAERYAALFDRIDAAWSRGSRVSGNQAKEVVA